MTPTTDYQKGVNGVTDLAREVNSNIGSYVEHFYNDNFDIVVRLTNNGTIKMSLNLAQDYEAGRSYVDDLDIIKVAKTYRLIPK